MSVIERGQLPVQRAIYATVSRGYAELNSLCSAGVLIPFPFPFRFQVVRPRKVLKSSITLLSESGRFIVKERVAVSFLVLLV